MCSLLRTGLNKTTSCFSLQILSIFLFCLAADTLTISLLFAPQVIWNSSFSNTICTIPGYLSTSPWKFHFTLPILFFFFFIFRILINVFVMSLVSSTAFHFSSLKEFKILLLSVFFLRNSFPSSVVFFPSNFSPYNLLYDCFEFLEL